MLEAACAKIKHLKRTTVFQFERCCCLWRLSEGICEAGGGCWMEDWRALNCSENAPKRPEGQLASIRLVTGPSETQIGIGGARNSQECGLRPILGRQEPRDMLPALKKGS